MGRVYRFGRRRSGSRERRRSGSPGRVWRLLPSVVGYLRRREILIGLLVVLAAVTLYWRLNLSSRLMGAGMPAGVGVVEGDRLIIGGTEYQLYGIDAPEGKQTCRDRFGRRWKCGSVAARALRNKIRRGAVDLRCTDRGKDQYERTLGVCRQGDVDLNDWLVREGYAVAYRRYSSAYLQAEAEARSQVKGLWSGEFVMPWEWRQGKRLE